jgi:signal transduction histidine kinase
VRRADDLAPHLVPAVETIIAESARASDLVQQILDFSRPSALKVESVDLVSLLNKALDVLDTTLPEDVDLVTAMEAESCPVEADPTRLHQVVMNLINNARDAMPDGGCLRIALSPLTVKPDGDPPVAGMEPGDWARLTVSDDGVGMTEEVKARIFEPFFTTKGRGEGTGLGLAQVYGIVEQHAGHIDVETEPGVGSAFHVYLPRGG